jgi:hypothetical protein
MGDARVVGKTEAIAAHVPPHAHGVVGYVLLVAVAGEIEEVCGGLIDHLANCEIGQGNPNLGGQPGPLFGRDIDVREMPAVGELNEADVVIDHRSDRVQSGVAQEPISVSRRVASSWMMTSRRPNTDGSEALIHVAGESATKRALLRAVAKLVGRENTEGTSVPVNTQDQVAPWPGKLPASAVKPWMYLCFHFAETCVSRYWA